MKKNIGYHEVIRTFNIDLSNYNIDELAKEYILAAVYSSSVYNKKALIVHGLVGTIA